jgi:hypothetical protein
VTFGNFWEFWRGPVIALQQGQTFTIKSKRARGGWRPKMRWILVGVLLLVIAVPAIADQKQDEFDQKNVYEAFGELKIQPSPGVRLEEDVTSRIKRYMASLLYPVDMTSFGRPEKDSKLRELIVTLQKQMGEATTGALTIGQFLKLQDAARSIDERPVTISPGIMVYRSDDGNLVGAVGTGVMNDLVHPINISRILCTKSDGTCEMSIAEFDHKYSQLFAPAPTIYDVKTWTPNRVTAIREHPCGSAFLTVDVATKDVTITSAPHSDLPFCSKEPANIWKLADGFNVSWNLYLDRYNKARELVYEPAKRMFPIRTPAN